MGGVTAVDVNGLEGKAAEIELVAHLQRHQQVLLHIGGILVVLDLADLALHRVDTRAAVFRIKSLGADGEIGSIESQGTMHLIPRNAEGHHHVGHGVSLGEQVADLGEGVDVPLGHFMLVHGLLPALFKALLLHLALTDGLHDLKAHLRIKTHGDEIEHNIVTAAHRLQNGGSTIHNEVAGVAQPHIRTVGETGEAHQGVKVLRLGVHQHLTGEAGVELGDGHGARGA